MYRGRVRARDTSEHIMSKRPTFGSLFSGIGGFDLGLERAGWEAAWQVEINEFRRRVLAKHWPDVPRYEDIRELEELPYVDLIAAGFPCQPFSVAGRNRGEADERNLWPETIRVLRMVGPRLALLENVPGLLAHGYFGTILGDLSEAGYDAEWFCVLASYFGATHRRERLFIVAYRNDGQSEPANGEVRTGRDAAFGESGDVAYRQRVGGQDGAAAGERSRRYSGSGDTLAHSEGDIRGASGDDGRVPLDGSGGGDVAYAGHAGESGRLAAEISCEGESCGEPSPQGVVLADAQDTHWRPRSESLQSAAGFGRRGLTGNGSRLAYSDDEGPQGRDISGNGRGERTVGPGSAQQWPPGPEDGEGWARVLAEVPSVEPAVCRVASGVPDRAHRLSALGDSVVPLVVEWIGRRLL